MITYLGKVVATTGASAVLVYSLKDNSTVVGVLGGGINLGILNKELQSLNLTSLDANLNSFRNAIKIVGGRRLLPYCVYHS